MAQISNGTSNTLVPGTNGHDSIYNWSDSVTIDTGTGNDTVHNSTGDSVTINTGAGDDSIYNYCSSSVTINAGAGNDNIHNEDGNYVTIDAGAGNDTVRNYGSIVTIDTGDGADTVIHYKHWVGSLQDYVGGSSVTIDAGTGDDIVSIEGGADLSISGGDGNDSIVNGGSYVTINGGAGDDYIDNGGQNILFQHTSGNDTIKGFNNFDTLEIASSSYTTEKSENNIIVTTNKGTITLIDAAGFSPYIETGTDTTPADTTPADTTPADTTPADTTPADTTPADTTPADTTPADTTPADTTPADTTPADEEGKIITNKKTKANIVGTAYEDEIYNRANTVTIKGGDGGDYLSTLRKTTSVKIYGEDGDDTLEAYNATKVLLNGGAGNDEIYSSGSNNTIIGGVGNDTIEIDSTNTQIQYAAGDGNDVIDGFNETTTLKIGNGTTDTYFSEKKDDDVIVTVGDNKITLSGAAALDTLNILGTFVDNMIAYNDKSKAAVTVTSGIEIVDATKRTKAIKITGNALDNSIVGGSGKDTLYGGDSVTSSNDTLDGGAGADKLYGRLGDDYLYGGTGNDTLDGGAGEDTLWGGSGNDSLIGGADADLFIYSGGKDVIKDYVSGEDVISLGGAVSKSTISGNNVVLTIGSGTLTIRDAKYKEISFIDAKGNDYTTMYGGLTLDNAANSSYTTANDIELVDATARTTAIKITGNELNNTILGSSGKNTINGMDGADSIIGGKSYDTLNGGEGNDYLAGGAGNDKLYGDDDDDTLWGGTGNDTLTGGAGNDLFIYSGGKDVIADYVSGEDVISLGGAISKSAASGSDVTLTVNKSTLTLKNARGKEITFVDAEGNESTEIFGKTIVKTAEYVAKDDEIYLDGSARTKATKITGNELNNTIFGGSGADTIYGEDGADSLLGGAGSDKLYGGEGDDFLIGGKGNDSLWGNDGSDTFVYNAGDGKDVIYGFGDDDMLQLNGVSIADISAKETETAFVFTINSSNTITFKQCSTETFNINGEIYEVKGKVLSKTER